MPEDGYLCRLPRRSAVTNWGGFVLSLWRLAARASFQALGELVLWGWDLQEHLTVFEDPELGLSPRT